MLSWWDRVPVQSKRQRSSKIEHIRRNTHNAEHFVSIFNLRVPRKKQLCVNAPEDEACRVV